MTRPGRRTQEKSVYHASEVVAVPASRAAAPIFTQPPATPPRSFVRFMATFGRGCLTGGRGGFRPPLLDRESRPCYITQITLKNRLLLTIIHIMRETAITIDGSPHLDGRSRRAQRGNARPSGTSSTRGAVLTAQQSRLLALVRFKNIVRSMNSAQLGHPS